MPSQKENIIYVDSTTEQDNRNSGWYKRTNNSINNLLGSQLAIEENKTLRVQDSTIDLPGVIRFNTTLSKFQGYTGNEGEGSDGWTSFQTFNGVDGINGTNAISEMVGNNNQLLTDYFESITKQGGEGVMLHLASAKHTSGRSDEL